MQCLTRLTVIVALATLSAADGHAEARKLPGYHADLSFKVTGFTRADDVLGFSIDGVSMNTPFSEIRDILTARGYEEEFQPALQLHFIKGAQRRVAGTLTQRIKIDDRDGGRHLFFMREQRDGHVSENDTILFSEQPLPASADVEMFKQLKSIVCDGIPDATEKWQLCPPNFDDEARISMGSAGVTLVDGLVIGPMNATPLKTLIKIQLKP